MTDVRKRVGEEMRFIMGVEVKKRNILCPREHCNPVDDANVIN